MNNDVYASNIKKYTFTYIRLTEPCSPNFQPWSETYATTVSLANPNTPRVCITPPTNSSVHEAQAW